MSSKKRHADTYRSYDREDSYKRSRPTTICDSNGHIIIKLGENLTSRYKVIDRLGEGTFGKVLSCWDREKREFVAIKVIRNVKKYRDAAMIEIDILDALRKADPDRMQNLIRLRSTFNYYGHYCLVFRQYGLSVYDFMKKNYYRPFTLDLVQSLSRQLLEGVAFMHDLTLIHTDLKPENILFSDSSYEELPLPPESPLKRGELIPKNSSVKVIDLGSATYDSGHHTTVVSTRHYRAPEVILNIGWTYPCDIWSIGCIIVELYMGEALFQTHDNLEHMAIMERVLGPLPRSMCRHADPSLSSYFHSDHTLRWPEKAANYESEKYVRGCKRLSEIFKDDAKELLDLVAKLLEYEPTCRISAREALDHPFFKKDYSSYSKLSTKAPSVPLGTENEAPNRHTCNKENNAQAKSSDVKATPSKRAPAVEKEAPDAVEDGAPVATVPKLSEPLRDRSDNADGKDHSIPDKSTSARIVVEV